jgi:hypothetical protein
VSFFEKQRALPLSVGERLENKPKLAVVGVVTNSVELGRILALPRRKLDPEGFDDATVMFEREGSDAKFWPIQSAALIEAAQQDGLFAPIGVGHGKTLISLALPDALSSKKAVLLVPPALKRQLSIEIESFYQKQFSLPIDRITVIAYSELSSAKKATILEDIAPDLIIADEAHHLRHKTSARTKRFLRYAKNHPECRFAFLSGTMTTRSIKDYAHLIELALRKNSPLPHGYRELKDWAGALDVTPEYLMAPGALKKFCDEGEEARDGFRRRLVDTGGVVATKKGALGTSLVIRRLRPQLPEKLFKLMAQVRKTWAIEDDEFSTSLELARVLRQLACGFHYRWAWPGDEKDHEWLDARSEWNREVRQKLTQSLEGFDSPLLLSQAAERYFKWDEAGREKPRPKKTWDSATWADWRNQKDKKPPPTATSWVDQFLVRESIAWAEKSTEPAIIWYEHRALGEAIAHLGEFPHYGAATDASQAREPVIVCSMKTQGTGKNLQHYCQNLFTSLPPNGATFEQIVGRTHRPGQMADEVTVDWFGHTPETEAALASVIDDAEYAEKTTGALQKVLYATRIF